MYSFRHFTSRTINNNPIIGTGKYVRHGAVMEKVGRPA